MGTAGALWDPPLRSPPVGPLLWDPSREQNQCKGPCKFSHCEECEPDEEAAGEEEEAPAAADE